MGFYVATKPRGDFYRTYKFWYDTDNPSDEFLRHRILNEAGQGTVQETFYTLNLGNAKKYFDEQIKQLHADENMDGLGAIYRKLTKGFMINDFIIKDEFDVFVAFETMNNRGKKLSDLELLKNRLIYLTTLYDDTELDKAGRKNLRDTINNAWKEIYHQLGREKDKPLNDDEFLKAHWTMYFQYTRKKGKDYIRFLLDEHFTPQKVHKKVPQSVHLDPIEEQHTDSELMDEDIDENNEIEIEAVQNQIAQLSPIAIQNYVNSLKSSSVHWFNTYHPHKANELSENESDWICRLNRIGAVHFRPLMMAILKSNNSSKDRSNAFKSIERFIFIAMRLTNAKSNHRDSIFYNAARLVDSGDMTLDELDQILQEELSYAFNDVDRSLRCEDLFSALRKKFESKSKRKGWYAWTGLHYFLYEYEQSLLDRTRHSKVDWADLLKNGRDRISIEHVYPQTADENWDAQFDQYDDKWRSRYCGSLGNLLLLSGSINSSLQNHSFENKKSPILDSDNTVVRNGYSDGSHSEIEVSRNETWGPTEIRDRGLQLLAFMEERWNFNFPDEYDLEKLLHVEVDPKLDQ